MSVFQKARKVWPEMETVNACAQFVDTFRARAGKAILRVSADAEYVLYLNGGDALFGQYADFPQYKVYDEYEVELREGENALAADGYCPGTDFFTYRANEAGVIWEIEQDGEIVLSSGDTTLARPHPGYRSGPIDKITGQLGFTFDCDLNAEGAPFAAPRAMDAEKQYFPRPVTALRRDARAGAILASQGAYLESGGVSFAERMQRAYIAFRSRRDMTGSGERPRFPSEAGVSFDAPDGDGVYLLLDLGREDAGILDIELETDEVCEVMVGWGEQTDDLRLRTYVGGRCFGSRCVFPAGRARFRHYFRRLGLRYVQLFVRAHHVKLYYAGLIPTPYPLRETRFHVSDRLHARIFDVSARTLELCVHEHYEDCPWREQGLYAMDSRNQMLAGYYAFGEYDMPKASLRLLALSQREDGMLELCAPARARITIPSFTAMFLVSLQEYLLFSGDLDFGREMLSVARKIADAFAARVNQNGLLARYEDPKYWNFYEWRTYLEGYVRPEGDAGERFDAPLSGFVCLGLRAFADTLSMLGEGDAAGYRDLADRIARGADEAFWDEKMGAYASFKGARGAFHYAELTQALLILCGAAKGERLEKARDALAGGALVPATTSYTVFQFDALLTAPERYAKFVFDRVARDWGQMLEGGATSFWETMDGAWDFDDAGSLCHGWSAIPIYLYYRYALGLYPAAPGFAKSTIAPLDCGLYELSGAYRTRDGREISL